MAAIPFIGGFLSNRGAKKNQREANRNIPANAAMPYFQQNPQEARNSFEPYMQSGRNAEYEIPNIYSQMNGIFENMPDVYNNMPDLYSGMKNLYEEPSEMSRGYGSMAQDPQEYISKIMRGYTPSEGYKYKEGRMNDAARSAASSGGFAGTRYDQEKRAEMIRGLLGEDQQQYLGNVMGAQGAGLSGLERLLEGRSRGQALQLGGQERSQANRLGGMERRNAISLAGRQQALQGRANMGEYQADRGFNAARALAEALIGNNNQMGQGAMFGAEQRNRNNAERNQSKTDIFSNILNSIPQSIPGFGGR